ncbi:ATP-binding protein [Actinacidiphila epipremni]|uniref:ATP-binding protein n=1 Tax=Actinacidiphila epipremni TaxID=2053013 RepID=A0ABX0ZZL2_9ACTN|nr:ATP-binding protein [Actinacidiphila epipremni]NJP47724.1 ATP-binding protein [Actinacidiphila epipremni]
MRNASSTRHMELPCEPSAVQWARVQAQDVLKGWEVPAETTEDALLVISELVTNCLRHAATSPMSPGCLLSLRRLPDHVLVCVYDDDRRPPVLRHPAEDEPGGRGLQLVAGLSRRWGYSYPAPTSGKAVWAQLPLPANPEARA